MTDVSIAEDKSAKGMRAARYYGKEDIQIKNDVPRPKVQDGQIKIEPAYVGICGTDLHEYLGGPTFCPTSPHPVTQEQIPVTIGHEFSGTITEVGKGVENFKVGQEVAVQPTIFCGGCGPCQAGAENSCTKGGFVGLSGAGGGMSEEVVVPERAVFALPKNIDLEKGALVEPLAVAWHAVDVSPIADYEQPKCIVFGGGPIGLSVVQVLLARGANPIICVEVAQKRQQFAKDFGAHYIIDPTKEDVAARALEICGGVNGPDIAWDCAGVKASVQAAFQSIRPRGTVVNVAIWEDEIGFNPNWLVFGEKKYVATLGYQRKDYEGVIDALAKEKLKPGAMITSKITMDNLVKDGYNPLINEKDKHVKILVDVKA